MYEKRTKSCEDFYAAVGHIRFLRYVVHPKGTVLLVRGEHNHDGLLATMNAYYDKIAGLGYREARSEPSVIFSAKREVLYEFFTQI